MFVTCFFFSADEILLKPNTNKETNSTQSKLQLSLKNGPRVTVTKPPMPSQLITTTQKLQVNAITKQPGRGRGKIS